MNIWLTYGFVAVILVIAELVYFRIADKCNIIDRPNERSSHSTIVLRGGGIIFAISMIAWAILMMVQGSSFSAYLPFLCGLVLICGISFWDDVHSLPDSVRLVVQFVATTLMFWSIALGSNLIAGLPWYWLAMIGIVALVVFVGATDVINFMDGINGITAGYALAVLVPLALVNGVSTDLATVGFIEPSYLIVAILGVLVFSFFNFRPKGKAKCFAGDVGSIGIAFIMLFAIGKLILKTNDLTWLVFLLVYGVDGCLTIGHRIMLHENLGEAHRKHAYQLMANELGIGHAKVASFYALLQMAISLGFVYLCPVLARVSGMGLVAWHWIYLVVALVVLAVAYVLFMRKFYHLYEEYLSTLKK